MRKRNTFMPLTLILSLLFISVVYATILDLEFSITSSAVVAPDQSNFQVEFSGVTVSDNKVAYEEGSGYTSSIDSSFAMKDVAWRVLGVSGHGELELISSQPTDSKLTLSGEDGYLYGPDNLDTLCDDLYGNGTGAASARSLKVEDINKLGNYTPSVPILYQYQYSATAGYMQYRISRNSGTSWGSWTNITSSSYQTFKEPGKTVIDKDNYLDEEGNQRIAELPSDSYSYTISSKITSTTADGISMASLITQGLNDANSAASGSNITQWMSSRCVRCGSYSADFYVRRVHSGNVNSSFLLWYSRGTSDSGSYAVRPVVSLNSEISLDKVGDTWNIVE